MHGSGGYRRYGLSRIRSAAAGQPYRRPGDHRSRGLSYRIQVRRESCVELTLDDRLHLATSMRSFRSEKVSAFVKALLDRDEPTAQSVLKDVSPRYPIVITRDLSLAKQWIKNRARGSEQFGLVASSEAQRLKLRAIDVRVNVDPIHWFLGDRTDTRSCFYLEDAATQFQIQGLEVDWTTRRSTIWQGWVSTFCNLRVKPVQVLRAGSGFVGSASNRTSVCGNGMSICLARKRSTMVW
jgi:hypothetical protein